MNNDIRFLNIEWRTWNSLTNFEDHFGLHASVIFRHQYVWFPSHLYVICIPNSSGQLTKLFVYNYSSRVDLYSHQIVLCGIVLLHVDKFPYPCQQTGDYNKISLINGLEPERCNSSALAMELRFSCINPSWWCTNNISYEIHRF